MNEVRVVLDKFKPRPYQLPIFDAIENKKYKKVMAILPRRAGKDIAAWNLCIRECLKKVGTIFYILPTYAQAKKVIWNSITIDGTRFLDFIPPEVIYSQNAQEMSVCFINGSRLQLVGSDNYDSLMGSNPMACVFSEFSLQNPLAYEFLRPILAVNGGWALFLSTPRGKNHLWDKFKLAKELKDEWFAYIMTVDDTKHLSPEQLALERREMSEDLIQQEYYCSFNRGVDGSIYAHYINDLRLKGQIGPVPWESSHKVSTAWDIGFRDATSIIFFQQIGQTVRIIDYYEKNLENLEHFAKVVHSKPYIYDKHYFPHDMRMTEWAGPKFTRAWKANELGIKVNFVDEVGLADGIEFTCTQFPKLWFDETRCQLLINHLENYRYEYDERLQRYKDKPLHDKTSHGADALRYLCLTLPKGKDALSARELDQRFASARSGGNPNLPPIFR